MYQEPPLSGPRETQPESCAAAPACGAGLRILHRREQLQAQADAVSAAVAGQVLAFRDLVRDKSGGFESKAWEGYGAARPEVLCWSNCFLAGHYLREALQGADLKLVEHMAALPFETAPYGLGRSVDPIGPQHCVDLLAEPPLGRFLFDPTFKQFLAVQIRPDLLPAQRRPFIARALAEAGPDILVLHESELPRACLRLAEIVWAANDGRRMRWPGAPEMARSYFSRIWDLDRYRPRLDSEQTMIDYWREK